MPRRPKFFYDDIVQSAAAVIAEAGPANATIAQIASRLGAPTGSIYHRFPSRDVLLATVWLETIESFQRGFQAALSGDDPWGAGLAAALHTPLWVRQDPGRARILLLYRRQDFAGAGWPRDMKRRAKVQWDEAEQALEALTRRLFARASSSALRRVQFAVVDAPYAAVLRHVAGAEPPPSVVDQLIAETYRTTLNEG